MQPQSENVVTFTVPYLIPPSVNHSYKPVMYTGRDGFSHRGRKLTKEAKAFKEAVAIFARGLTVVPTDERERRKARYRVTIDVYLGPRQRGDYDNFNKIGVDALQYAGVIDTDYKAVSGTTNVIRDQRDDPRNPRTDYTIERLEKR